jgi:hypothetical protein
VTGEKAPPGELSREDLVAMFKDIVAGMDSLIFQLARRERQLRSQEQDKEKVHFVILFKLYFTRLSSFHNYAPFRAYFLFVIQKIHFCQGAGGP